MIDHITESELSQWEELCNSATPGPWHYHEKINLLLSEQGDEIVVGPANAGVGCFIEASRSVMPRLIAEVRRLKEENEQLENWGSTLVDSLTNGKMSKLYDVDVIVAQVEDDCTQCCEEELEAIKAELTYKDRIIRAQERVINAHDSYLIEVANALPSDKMLVGIDKLKKLDEKRQQLKEVMDGND